jgi:hypothetical protein
MTIITWDPSNTGNATLSNGNLTLTGSGGSYSVARATGSYTTGKYYYETTIVSNAGTGDGSLGIGLANASENLNSSLGYPDANGIGYYPASGAVYFNLANQGTIQTSAVGAVVRVAIDYGAKKIWFSTNGGNWNNNGTADPVAGTGAISFSGVSGPYFPAAAVNSSPSVGASTTNFGGSAYAYTAPTGYGAYTIYSNTVRVTQAVAEALIQSGRVRVSQVVAEILATTGNGNVRVSQAVSEVLTQSARVRVSQAAMEILVSTANQIPGNVAVFVMA